MAKDIKDIPFRTKVKTHLYTKGNALDLIDLLEEHSIELYGYDGFRTLPNGIQIEQEYSNDFGAPIYNFKSYSDPEIYLIAKKHIKSLPEDVWFEIVFNEQND